MMTRSFSDFFTGAILKVPLGSAPLLLRALKGFC